MSSRAPERVSSVRGAVEKFVRESRKYGIKCNMPLIRKAEISRGGRMIKKLLTRHRLWP